MIDKMKKDTQDNAEKMGNKLEVKIEEINKNNYQQMMELKKQVEKINKENNK